MEAHKSQRRGRVDRSGVIAAGTLDDVAVLAGASEELMFSCACVRYIGIVSDTKPRTSVLRFGLWFEVEVNPEWEPGILWVEKEWLEHGATCVLGDCLLHVFVEDCVAR